MSLETRHFYDFDNFRLDLTEQALLRDGKPVAITPKALHLLRLLVENHGEVVKKERLISEIWADSFVEEGNLAVSVAMARKALADDASRPKFIETVPRRGYRFVAKVRENREVGPEAEITRSEDSGRGGNRVFRTAAVLVLVVAALGVGVWLVKGRAFGEKTTPILSAPFASTKFSSSGTVNSAVISPDGKYAAFIDGSGGGQSLWLRQLDSGENIQIVPSSPDHYLGLTFTNDGTSIYFSRRAPDAHQSPAVYRVAAFGGIPVKVADGALNWIGLSPDDKQVSFVRCRFRPDDNCSLYVANADGTGERRLFSQPAPSIIESNRFSPDGRFIAAAYGKFITGKDDYRIGLIDVETGAVTEISTQAFFDIKSLQWLPSGDGLLFTVRDHEDGRISIWKVPAAGGPAENITKDAATYQDLSLDAAGERMIATQVENDYQIYIGKPSEWRPLTSARDATVGPDGRIVYSTFDGDIWSINSSGGERRQLTSGPAGDLYPQLSPDGARVYFKSTRNGGSHVWRINADGTEPRQVTGETGGGPCGSTADGKWLYFTKDKNLYRVPADGGDESKVSDVRMLRAVCSPNAERVAYFFLGGGFKIGVMNTASGKVESSFEYGDGKALPQYLGWSPDNRTVNFVLSTGGRNALWQRSIDEAAPRMVADLGGDEIRDLAVMPDGSIVFVRGKWINNAVLITGLR